MTQTLFYNSDMKEHGRKQAEDLVICAYRICFAFKSHRIEVGQLLIELKFVLIPPGSRKE